MKHLVIGMGEVGNSIFNVLRSKHPDIGCRDRDPVIIQGGVETLHIAINYSDKFEDIVKKYKEFYRSSLVIVYSTTPIGTCEKLGAVHSPIEGKHPAIGLSIQNSARWLGSSDEKALKKAKAIWEKIVPVRELPKADFTEWLKLRSTSKYGLAIAWAEYENQVCQDLDLDYAAVKQFDLDYNEMYKRLGMLQFQRYILDPPEGPIGGHCVLPNAEILDKQYPSDMLKLIKEVGK